MREALLGGVPRDYDFVLRSTGDLGVIEQCFGARAFPLGKKPLQTYRMVLGEGTTIDVTFLERTIEDDLLRRDFTMNAVAFEVRAGSIIDTAGGLRDIDGRTIRYPGRYTLIDDPLRMLKALRHFATLDNFTLDGPLVEAIEECRSLIRSVAPERVRYELDLIMASPRVYEALKVAASTGLLMQIVPALEDLVAIDEEQALDPPTFGHTLEAFRYLPVFSRARHLDGAATKVAGYALLFHDLGKARTLSYDAKKEMIHFFFHEKVSQEIASGIMDSLRFSSDERRRILGLVKSHMRIFLLSQGESTERALRRLVYDVGDEVPLLVVLTLCDMYGSSGGQKNPSTERVEKRCDEVLEVFAESKKTPLPRIITGRDLLAMGFAEGPEIGRVLSLIRDRQITGEVTETGQALKIAQALLSGQIEVR